jgi:hypothetical protein
MTRIIGTIRYGVVSLLFCLICFSGISGNFSSAKELSKDLESRAISYDHLAQELMMKMDYDSAYVFVNRGLKCLEGKNAPELMSGLLLCRAKVQTLRSNINAGMEDAQSALALADKFGYRRIKAKALLVISRIDIISYRDSLAEVHILESKRISE